MAQPTKPDMFRFAINQFRYVLPNAITILALCFGLTGLTYAAVDRYTAAIACVLVAALLDGCDGRVARATNSESRFGAELDSLADVICFGAVPAFVLFSWGVASYGTAGWLVCLAFAAASALRLARFNVAATEPAKPSWMANYFTGVPTPAGALLAFTPIYIEQSGWFPTEHAVTLAMFSLPIVAALLVSNWPTFSAKSVSRKAIRVKFLPSLILALTLIAALLLVPWVTFTLCALAYLASLPFSKASHARRRSQQN